MAQEQPEVVSPSALMNERESSWSRKMASVSLAAELPVEREYTEQTLGVLGRIYRLRRPKGDHNSYLRRWPAVHVLSTVGVAAHHYEQGAFWPGLVERAGLESDQQVQRDWGTAFLENLKRLGLPTFSESDDAGTAYVGRILLHSGVPTYCLTDYYRLVEERRRKSPELDAATFVAWAVDARLSNVDKPVVRFLKYGGEFAVDVTDRVFDLLDVVSAGGDPAMVPLPDRFLTAAQKLADKGELVSRTTARRTVVAVEKAAQPSLYLDPYGRGPMVRLPAVSEAPDGQATWLVSIDGRNQEVRTRALWPGSGEPAPQTDVPIPGPARTATVALHGHAHLQATISVVDDKDALLAFDEDGHRLPPGLPWKGLNTWLLFPGAIEQLKVDGELRVLAEAPLPPGWAGWRLVLADLSRVQAVAGSAEARRHTIQAFVSARIATPPPVQGVRTRTGDAVYGALPSLELPTEFGPESTWDVTVTDGRGDLLMRRTLTGADETESLWDDLPAPHFGSYSIKVRGPWGRGAERRISVVQGLTVDCTPEWRRLSGPEGLVPARVEAAAGPSVYIDRRRLDLKPGDIRGSVVVSTPDQQLLLTIEPPHLSLSYLAAGFVRGPSVRPLELVTEAVAESPGFLTVDVGAAAEPRLHAFVRGDHVQVLAPYADSRGGIYRFNLAQITDTIRTHPQVRLCLDPEGCLEIALLRPARLFSGVEVNEGRLVFTDCVQTEDLTALVYSMRAPWRSPARLPVRQGETVLPEDLHSAGPLLVHARLEDPWVPEPIPNWPTKAMRVVIDGHIRSQDPQETALSAFLAGEGEMPQHDVNLVQAWAVLCRSHRLVLPDLRTVALALSQHMKERPVAGLLALPRSNADNDALPPTLVRAGLAATPADARATVADLEWSRRGVLSSMLLLHTLPIEERQEALESASLTCGDIVFDLANGNDPAPAAGRFDESADRYDALDHQTRALFRTQAAFVPRGLLDADSRGEAALRLLETRSDHDLGRVIPKARAILAELDRLFALIDAPKAAAAVRARTHPTRPTGWRVLPAISMGFANAARYAAHGNAMASGWIEQHRNGWAQLAAATPDLVTVDLIIAELNVSRVVGRTQEEPS